MAPRKYNLNRRAEAIEETRRRILLATMQLHAQQGIIATTYEDIARRADVSPATVYRHFPTLNELVPACGALSMKALPPPDESIYSGRDSTEARVRAFVGEWYAYWERAHLMMERARQDADRLPVLASILKEQATFREQLLRMALPDDAAAEDLIRLTLALTDLRTWAAFAEQGMSLQAPELVIDVIMKRLTGTEV